MRVSPGIAIVKREFLSGLRNRKPFYFLAAMLFVMIVSAVFMLYTLSSQSQYVNGSFYGPDLRQLFTLYSMALYSGAMLLIPPMAAVAICVEKQQGSYELLKMTYIRPLAIAVAKFSNVMGIYALVVIATMPLAGLFFFFVGIDWVQFTQSMLIVFSSAICCAAVGIFCSAWLYRTLPAVITTYMICIMLQGGFLFLLVMIFETFLKKSWLYSVFRMIPDDILLSQLPGLTLLEFDGRMSLLTVGTSVVVYGSISLLAFWGALVLIRQPLRVGTDNSRSDDSARSTQTGRRTTFGRRRSIPEAANPMLYKELRSGLFGQTSYSAGIFFGFTGVCLIVSASFIGNEGRPILDYASRISGALLFDTILVLLFTPAFIATAMAKEYEWGNWDLLNTTLLTPGEILSGKLRTALLSAALPMAAAALGTLPMVHHADYTQFAWSGYVSGLGTMLICVIYVLCLTLLVTVRCRHSLPALMQGYGASAMAIVVFSGAIFFFLIMGSRYRSVSDDVERIVNFLSPLLAKAMMLKDASYASETWMLTPYWIANCVCFTMLSAALLWLAKVRFTRSFRRVASDA